MNIIGDQTGAAIRTGLTGIPTIGSVLAQGWSEWDSMRRFERIESAITDIGKQINKHHSFNPQDLNDSDYQLFEEVMRRVQFEHCEKKRRRYAKLLAQCWTDGKNETFDKRFFSLEQLKVLVNYILQYWIILLFFR